ncbi:putative ribonuclease H-like domain-containing protein [Tanacetum coccineum]
MKENFEQIEAEVEQNAMDKQCADIERKNLLIENENLIVDCLSNELLYNVINVVNTVSRFSEMHDAYTVEQARCLELEAEISKLKHKIQKDDHSEMIKHFSNLEIDHLNLQLEYQNLKECFGNNQSQTSQDTPEFDSFFKINKMKEKLQGKNNTNRKLKEQISYMNERRSAADRTLDFKALDSQNIELTEHVTALQEQNKRFRAENEKVKQHYKELYDSIKITRAKTIEKTTSLLTENEKLKAQLKGKIKCITMDTIKSKVLAPGMYAIDVEPILPHNRNNREVHLDYIKHLEESVETLQCVIGTCSKEFSKRDKKVATTPLNRKKQVTFKEPCDTSNNNTQTHVEQQKVQQTNVPVLPSTGVISSTEASRSKPRSNTKKNRIFPAKSDNKKKVEAHPRNNKSNLKQENRVDFSISSKRTVPESPPPPTVKNVLSKVRQVWKATGKLFKNVGYQWKPIGKKFTLGEQCPLTRFTHSKVVPLQQPKHVSTSEIMITERFSNTTQNPLTRYKRRSKKDMIISTGIPTTATSQPIDVPVKYTTVSANQQDPNRIWGSELPNSPSLPVFKCRFIDTVRFGNDHFGAIRGYVDYMISDSVISNVYYVEGVGIKSLFEVTAVKMLRRGLEGMLTTLKRSGESSKDKQDENFKASRLSWQMAMLTNEGKEILEEIEKADCEGNLKHWVCSPMWSVKLPTTQGTICKRCHGPRNQENMNRENTRRVVPVEITTPNALISCDGLGDYDWSDQAEEGLESIEARLLVYKKNEVVYEEDIKLLKREIYLKEVAITELRRSGTGSKTKDEIQLINIAQPKTTVNSARPMSNVFNKAHLTVRRPINNKTTTKNSDFNNRVNIVSGKNVNTAWPKAVFNAARSKALLNDVKENQVNAVKASACLVWKPKTKDNSQMDLQDQGVIDSGYSRHMIGNMSYLTDFEEIDGGYVAFGGNPKGGKITGRAERKNRTLIEASRTMLADSKLPTTFWAGVVNTACYVQNRVLVTKPHNKTHYELFLGRKPALGFIRPFGCLVTILNTIDHLRKFDGKADEGFFVGYSINSKVFRAFNSRTRIVEENLHVQFSENTPNIGGSGPNWPFDIDALTKSMNYKLVVAGNQSNGNAGDNEKKVTEEPGKEGGDLSNKNDSVNNTNNINIASDGNNTNNVNTVSLTVNTAGIEVNTVSSNTSIKLPNDPNMPELEDIVYSDDYEDVGAEADMNILNTFIPVSPILTTRIHKNHPVEQIIGDLNLAPQTRRMTKNLEEHGLISSVQQRTNHKDFQNCVFARFLSQKEPKKVIHALKNPSWIKAMQDELLIFKLQKVWTLVDLPNGKRAIGTKWVFRNKKDERGIVIKNKARLFLAYASFKDFLVYQIDVKSAFLYGKIEEEVYVCQPPGFEDPNFPDRVYKVEKALYGLHQAPKDWYETLSTYLLNNRFQRGKIDKTLFIRKDKGDILLVQVYVGLQVKQKEDGIFISQDKYVTEILKKFGFTDVKTANTPMETQKPLLKDKDGKEVDVHLYRSMIGSLMYLTSLRPDIMFAVCQPKLGLWYPKDSPFDLVAYTDSDYARASLDRKSTTGDLLTKAFDVKTVNGEQQLQALVDRKKIIITEATVRRDLQLEDVDCLPNAIIFEQLTLMGRPKEKDTQAPQSSVPSDPINVADEAVTEEPISSKEASLGDQEDASKQGRKIYDIDVDEDITLENVHDVEMFDVNELDGDELVVESEVADKDVNLSVNEVTLAHALAALKSAKVSIVIPTTAATTITVVGSRPRAKGIVFLEQEQAPTLIVSSQQPTQVKDKGKGKMVEEEPVKKISKKDLLKLDEELAFKLQAKEDEEERLAREKAQKVKEPKIAWDDIQAKVEADYQLAQRLSKKQKADDDKETKELKQCMEIISDDGDDVTIEDTPLSTKFPTIVDYKIYKEVKKSYLQIIIADVKARFKKTEPVNYMDTFLHLNLKTMFEHHLEDNNILYYLLVEKMYPLTKHTLHQMFNDVKLQVDYECEMAFELLRLVKKQLKEGYVPQ